MNTEKQHSDKLLRSVGSIATFVCPQTGRETFQDIEQEEAYIVVDPNSLMKIEQ